jgi:hypothetical protein
MLRRQQGGHPWPTEPDISRATIRSRWRGLACRGGGQRDQRPQRHRAGQRRSRRAAQCAHGPAQGDRGDGRGEGAFVFYTNYDSAKGREIAASGKAAFVMHWKSLRRQIRVRGPVEREEGPQRTPITPPARSRAGWAPGPREQSRPLDSRATLMAEVAKVTAQQGTNPAAAVLGRLPHPPGGDRVLGRWRVPPA